MSNLNVALNTDKRNLRVRVNGAGLNTTHTATATRKNNVLTVSVTAQPHTNGKLRPIPSWKFELGADINTVVVKDIDGSTFYEDTL